VPATLALSDATVRDALGSISSGREWTAWLAGEDLVRRAVAAADAVAEGRSPRFAFDGVPIPGRFSVVSRGDRLFIAESSYARFDGLAAIAGKIEDAEVRSVWIVLRPLAVLAWAEIAPDERTLERVVSEAVDHLLATPLVNGSTEVFADGVVYRFADPRLEPASAAQKHLLRMGTANAQELLPLLRSLRELLGR
jgi:hypothetical protein